jgi:hypothetical protein
MKKSKHPDEIQTNSGGGKGGGKGGDYKSATLTTLFNASYTDVLLIYKLGCHGWQNANCLNSDLITMLNI